MGTRMRCSRPGFYASKKWNIYLGHCKRLVLSPYWSKSRTIKLPITCAIFAVRIDVSLCADHGSDNPFTIKPSRFHIDGHKTTTFECTFRPNFISNIYHAEFEATVHFDPDRPSSDCYASFETLPPYAVPMNVSVTATGTFETRLLFLTWKRKRPHQCSARSGLNQLLKNYYQAD